MRYLSLTFLFLFSLMLASAGTEEKFKQIKVFVPDKQTVDLIWSTGIDHEGTAGKIGGAMEFVAGSFELQELTRKGIGYEVVIADLAKHYEQQLTRGRVNAMGFGYGSMGGFYTFNEVLTQLDSLRLLYPNLISVRDSVGRSVQGRAVWAVKIGSSQSAGKPEVLYTALHHAREPEGMMSVLYYMWWLLENYATNPEAAYLVNHRQQWFIPVVNPDGYEYNRQTNPNGGGMWRKNRRDNGGGIYGVDPNRNYGPMYMWNSPYAPNGSSLTPSSETYRGTAPFSEPENQAIDNFMRAHNIKTCLNYHTYGNYLIYPYGYLVRENPDSLIYRDWAYDMTAVNRFTNGTDMQTVNYSTRGVSDDYMYGDTTKPRTYTMTPEVGTTGFWPTTPEIFPLAIGNLTMNKRLAYIAGHFTTIIQHSIQDAGGNGFLNRGENFSLIARIKNKGLTSGAFVAVRATSSLPSIQFSGNPVVLNPVLPQQEYQVNVTGSVAWNATEGVPVQFYVRISDSEGFEKIDTLNYFVGTPAVAFADSASNGISNWNTGTGWGLTSNAHTPPSAFTDSPSGPYPSSANNSLTLNSQVDLTSFNYAQLKFWTKWALEPTWDFATVEVSTNNGSTWTTLRTELSHAGSGRSGGAQPFGTWGYDSYNPGQNWLEQSVNLSSYVNRQIKVRFRVAADAGDQRDGFYVDDIRVYGYSTSVAPPDTGIVVRTSAFTFNGPIGRLWIDSTIVKNATASPVTVTVAESSLTTTANPLVVGGNGKTLDAHSLIARFKPAFEQANLSRMAFQGGGEPASPDGASNPNAYTTILTDDRGENGVGAADIFRVLYQYRTSVLGNFHDFRIVMGNLPDTNVVIVLSVDTDQEFRTGLFPTPFGVGPTSRDIGSEREILIDASGILIDSLTGLGRIRAGVVLDVSQDSIRIVGLPFLLNIQRDSVLTISTETIIGGINANSLNDPDRKMNLGFVATRISRAANPLPDFAPSIGHANIGGETGVSWTTTDRTSFTLAANESTYFRLGVLGAKPVGTHRSQFIFRSTGRQPVTIPITMNLTTPPSPSIAVTPIVIRDTLALGDSVTNTLSIRNNGGGTLSFVVIDTALTPWLTISPIAGLVDSGMTTSVSIKVRSAGLRVDTTYAVLLVVVSNDPTRPAIPIALTLRVRRTTLVSESGTIPQTFALHQNYPNPFNPETNISFDLPKNSFVTLKIFNLIGQEVATIVNTQLEAGTHLYKVAAEKFGLASGVYLYKMTAGDFVQTKKMILKK